jgi:hypothetical protein
LIPRISSPRLSAAGFIAADVAAIALPSVATDADKERSATTWTTACAHTENVALGCRLFFREVHDYTIILSPDDRRMIAPAARLISSYSIPATGHIYPFPDGRRHLSNFG